MDSIGLYSGVRRFTEKQKLTRGLTVDHQNVGHLCKLDAGGILLDLFEKFTKGHFTPGMQGERIMVQRAHLLCGTCSVSFPSPKCAPSIALSLTGLGFFCQETSMLPHSWNRSIEIQFSPICSGAESSIKKNAILLFPPSIHTTAFPKRRTATLQNST